MEFKELCQKRESVRSYASTPIEQEKLDYIMECVRLAPSAVNFQPWKFYIITKDADREQLQKCYHREWFATAPAYIVCCINHEEEWVRQSDKKAHGNIDIAIAVEHLCLAATEQGLGTCWVCNFDPKLCSEFLQLPENIEPAVLIPIGYADNVASKPKQRKESIVEYI